MMHPDTFVAQTTCVNIKASFRADARSDRPCLPCGGERRRQRFALWGRLFEPEGAFLRRPVQWQVDVRGEFQIDRLATLGDRRDDCRLL